MRTQKKFMDGISVRMLASFVNGMWGWDQYNAMSEEQKTFIQVAFMFGLNCGINSAIGCELPKQEPFTSDEMKQIRGELGPYLHHQMLASGRADFIMNKIMRQDEEESS